MTRTQKTFILISLFLAVFSPAVCPAGESLSIEIWCDLQPMSMETDAAINLDEEEAYQALFEEARLIFSGMIYGYTFSYIPPDNARGVAEYFTCDPIAEIPWGDARLRLVRRDVHDNRMQARFSYELEPFQENRIQSWQTLSIPYAFGRGEGAPGLSFSEKTAARTDAIKEAVRNHLRPKILNKPREITGEALLLECPLTIIKAGTYIATVKVKIDIKEIIPYMVY